MRKDIRVYTDTKLKIHYVRLFSNLAEILI